MVPFELMDKPKVKMHVTETRELRTQSELWHTANCLLEAGQKEPTAAAHQFRASLVFRAFSLEAFLNWLGQHIVPHWSYLERLKPREKLDLLTDIIQVTPDYGSRPWQIVKDLFDFRNDVAHGKPESLQAESEVDFLEFLSSHVGDIAQAQWEKFSTEANAVRAKEDVLTIATLLYAKAQVKHEGIQGPFSFGFKISHATLGQRSAGNDNF